ncbi:transglycosylase SLT domain-containing protein [Massilia sp. W12]|uniref:lytic transglycosylase domain-containing protein n=1 Tax=Massilia sp. W12 TaxID=3126507 RepID=UPI0030D2D9DA
MLNAIKRAIVILRMVALMPIAWAVVVRRTAVGILTTAHHTLSLIGLGVLIVLALMNFKPEFSQQMRDWLHELPQFAKHANQPQTAAKAADPAPAAIVAPAAGNNTLAVAAKHSETLHAAKVEAPAALAKSPFTPAARHAAADKHTLQEQLQVSLWLSKRYRVARDAASMLVATSYATAREFKLDPLLILAVMAVESGFNPYAESPMGAQGLMQVMSKVHHEKFAQIGGLKEALNPHANIRVGAQILKDYMARDGSVEGALKSYVGAAAFSSDSGYGNRVLAEYSRLKEVAGGKNVSTQSGLAAANNTKIETPSKAEQQLAAL